MEPTALAIAPFTPLITTLKLSNVPTAIWAHHTGLRRVGFDVIELLEVGGIFEIAEQRQCVPPRRFVGRLCESRPDCGNARDGLQRRGRCSKGAGLEKSSSGNCQM